MRTDPGPVRLGREDRPLNHGWPWRREPSSPPAIFAHRGLAVDRFENTIGAFEAAIAAGADGVEIDVSMTRDGRLVCFHDPDLVRVTGIKEPLRSKTFAEIRSFPLEGKERIPTLDEALDVMGPEVPMIIDMKPSGRTDLGLPTALLRTLRRRRIDASSAITVSSFDWLHLRIMARRAPDLRTGFLVARDTVGSRVGMIRLKSAPYAAIHPARAMVDPDRVARWHAAGLDVGTWVVNEPDEARRVADAGADYVVTDSPAPIAAVLRSG